MSIHGEAIVYHDGNDGSPTDSTLKLKYYIQDWVAFLHALHLGNGAYPDDVDERCKHAEQLKTAVLALALHGLLARGPIIVLTVMTSRRTMASHSQKRLLLSPKNTPVGLGIHNVVKQKWI